MSDYKGIRQRIGKKDSSLSPTPAPNPLQTRGFGKGIQARSAELPTTNLLQIRGFGSPPQPSRQQQEPPDIQTQLEQAEKFGYNAANIPTFPPGATQLPPTNSVLTSHNPNSVDFHLNSHPVIQPKLIGTGGDGLVARIQAKPLIIDQSPANVIQREILTMSVIGVKIGQTNLYSGTGQEVGKIAQGTRIVVDRQKDALVTKTKNGDKQLWRLVSVIDEEGITLSKGSLDDLWISSTRITDQAPEKSKAIGGELGKKLKEFADTMANYYAIHKKYKQYEKHIGNKIWNYFDVAWKWVNKILGWVSYIDPTGITSAIKEISQAVQKVASYIKEAINLMDKELLQEVTPLLQKGLNFQFFKDVYDEIGGWKDQIEKAWKKAEEEYTFS